MSTVLGIDPGSAGAAALCKMLHGRPILLAGASWRRSGTRWKVDLWTPQEGLISQRVDRHEQVTDGFIHRVPSAIVVEDVFVGRNAKTSILLARYAQMVVSNLHIKWPAPVIERRIMERDWRKGLGLPPSRPDVPDRAPNMMRRLVHHVQTAETYLGTEPHLYDAVALAYLGLIVPAQEQAWVDRFQRARKRRSSKSRRR